jgi:hypothetical protein
VELLQVIEGPLGQPGGPSTLFGFSRQSLNGFVGTQQGCGRQRDTECLSGLEIEHEL